MAAHPEHVPIAVIGAGIAGIAPDSAFPPWFSIGSTGSAVAPSGTDTASVRAAISVRPWRVPNFFCTLGPFGVAGNQSAIYMIEAHVRYIVDAVTTMRARNIQRIDVREEVQRAFLDEVTERSRDTAWLTGGCRSYYQSAEGGNAGLYPNWSFEYRWRTSRFDPESYQLQAG
ncbi:hypothetical protein [Nocardia arthritidis]|uniref:hypothetical protein n=1 Tax=Nocardia arthritidis TaxID=228602 RepID=UPI000A689BCD|nr:hypothetical protein [Nocardia arthritidis]